MHKLLGLLLFGLITISVTSAEAADVTGFDQAASVYKAGKYEAALAQFQALNQAKPGDVQIRYYMGLCNFCLHKLTEAGNEYEWVYTHTKDPAMKAIAHESLRRVGRYSKGIGGIRKWPPTPPVDSAAPVRKVLEFYTDWCISCKKFASTFEIAQKMYSGKITFVRLNAEDPKNWKLVSKYKVTNYPTLVYLDGQGRVLQNYAGSPMGQTFLDYLHDLGADK